MNRRPLLWSLGAICAVVALAASYAAGVRTGANQAKAGVDEVLASVQADLGLTKLHRLRELESDLTRGCAKEALAKVKFDIHTQLLVLSSFYKDYKDTWVTEKLGRRDPKILAELAAFKQQHQSWVEPKCAS